MKNLCIGYRDHTADGWMSFPTWFQNSFFFPLTQTQGVKENTLLR